MTRKIWGIWGRVVALALAAGIFSTVSANAESVRPTIAVTGTTAGAQAFISFLSVTVTPATAIPSIKTIAFTISPKQGSKTRAISATYSLDYLTGRGYVNLADGVITVPVFGLYANRLNDVTLRYTFLSGSIDRAEVPIETGTFNDTTPGQIYLNPTIVQPRSENSKLSYDFIYLKNYASANTPIIIDTDGEVRWAGTAGLAEIASIFFDNGVYISSGDGVVRMELDGTYSTYGQYADIGVTSSGHHNYDPGKYGFIMDVNTTGDYECVDLESDASGNIIKIWQLAEIISNAMLDGGDDPSAFVRPTADWFHNNSVTYRKSDDSIIISSRENFVICLDYNTNKIKWILGDPTKAWYTYPSLRKYALTLTPGSLPPIGQHALSISKNGNLLLFDDGENSENQTPAGASRTYSAAREYAININKMTATEVWHYTADEKIFTPFCSSVYEDAPGSYLIDWATETAGTTELVGFDASGVKAFDYTYPTLNFAGTAWNAVPIHLEDVTFH
jgi:arylsulfate sulfotransferase